MTTKSRTPLIVGLVVVAVTMFGVLGAGAWVGFERYRERQQERRDALDDLDRKVLPGSTDDATQNLVDEDYRFELLWPGAGYKVLREPEARKVGSGAIAGIVGDAGCAMLVTVEHVPGGEIETVARSIIEGLPIQEKQIELLEHETFQQKPAVRFEAQGKIQGMPYRIKSIVVERDGWFLQLVTWRPLATATRCEIDLGKSIKLLDGAIRGRLSPAVARDEDRPLFRVRDNLYEAPSQRLRVRVPAGTQLITGEEALTIDPDAAFILSAGSKSLVVSSLPLCGHPGPEYLEGLVRTVTGATGAVTGQSHSVALAGQSVSLVELAGPAPYVTLYGGMLIGDRVVILRGVYPPALAEGGRRMIDEAAAALQVLEPAEAEALQAQLAPRESGRLVRLGRSLRASRYQDFVGGVQASLPPDPSVASLDLNTPLPGFESPFLIYRFRYGVTSLVVRAELPIADLASEQRSLAAMVLGVTPADITPVGPGHFAFSLLAGPRGRFDLQSVERDGVRVHTATWGAESCVSAASAASAEFAKHVELGPPKAEETLTDHSVKNERLGFELSLPGAGWEIGPLEIPGAEAIAKGYQAKRGTDTVGVLGLHIDQAGRDPEFLVGFMEQVFAKKLAEKNDVPKRTDGSLGQLPARIIRYSDRFTAAIGQVGGTYFLVFVEKGPLSALDTEKVMSGFAVAP